MGISMVIKYLYMTYIIIIIILIIIIIIIIIVISYPADKKEIYCRYKDHRST